MTMQELYERLCATFGGRADPDTWWPVYLGRTDPPAFERAITNILVQNGSWKPVRAAVECLDRSGLLTSQALAGAAEDTIAACAKPTGLQRQKAARLKALGTFVLDRFGTERRFCEEVTEAQLRGIGGIGPETADRTLLFTCGRLAWPVDTYCLRVLAHHGVIPAVPATPAEKCRVVAEIKRTVETQMPRRLGDWRRLHALMQLEGEGLRKR